MTEGPRHRPTDPLPPGLASLVERLAAEAHEAWAESRRAEGWRHGLVEDPTNRTTPNLVAYAALPEPEKEVDRVLVRRVIAALLAAGCRIEPPRKP